MRDMKEKNKKNESGQFSFFLYATLVWVRTVLDVMAP